MNRDLAQYRLEISRENLVEAQELFGNKRYRGSVTRSYYAMFSAAKALLALKELNSSKHSGVIALFNQHFVKDGLVPRELYDLLSKAKDIREKSDYGDFITVTKEKAEVQLKNARYFLDEVTKSINTLSS